MRTGLRAQTPDFTVFVSKEPTPTTRFGFVISKTVGTAVRRNRIKRQLRSIAFNLLPKLNSKDFVIRVNPSAANSKFENLNHSMQKGLAGEMR
jgi:ribonuclease P protein component